MSKPNTQKNEDKGGREEVAQEPRERELRDLIDRVEAEKGGRVRPSHESPNDFVERRVREKFKQ